MSKSRKVFAISLSTLLLLLIGAIAFGAGCALFSSTCH